MIDLSLYRVVSVSCAALTLFVAACEAPPAPFSEEDVQLFEAALAETHGAEGTAGTLMIVTDGERRWDGAMGVADIASGRPVTEHTLVRSASVAKTFTGALILSLHEEGLLSIDDPLSRYLDTVPNADAITLRMLLQHTSGIANYAAVPAYREALAEDPTRVFTEDELVAFAVAQGPDFPPGVAWNYSNTGYILLGLIAESIVGRSLYEETRERFFEPLGMLDTRPVDMPREELWTSYLPSPSGPEEVITPTSYVADGGYVTSMSDMAIWARAFFGGHLHRPETLELAHMTAGGELLTTIAQAYGLESGGYGMGMVVASDAELGALYAGAGNSDGVRTFVGFLPEQDVVFAVAVNVGQGAAPLVETLSTMRPLLGALRARHLATR